ncbi:MAG: hypothetical protein AAFX93_01845 [Verrucomicrobiota bacterium]
MAKHLPFWLGFAALTFLLGFYTRGVIATAPQTPSPLVISDLPIPSTSDDREDTHVERLEAELETESALEPIDLVIFDPDNPVERLQALETVRYELPGSAFNRLVPDAFDDEHHISAEMRALMDLSEEETEQLNGMLDRSMMELRAIEEAQVVARVGKNGELTFTIPPYPDQGLKVRAALLRNIESGLGESRRHLFEMMLIQKPSSFGNFGKDTIAVRNPTFETVNGWREIVTIQVGKMVDIGTEDERFEGVERAFLPAAFQKRYGHFFDFE